MIRVQYQNDDKTRGNHTTPKGVGRISTLPDCIQEHIWTDDPCWSYLPPGWHNLVTQLHTNLVQVAPDYRIDQVKEKFGGLRFYTNIVYDANGIASIIIDHYEKRSMHICDQCGVPGTLQRIKRYIATRCEEHNKV